MDTNDLMQKILFEAKVDRERIFLDDAHVFLMEAVSRCEFPNGQQGLNLDYNKLRVLIDRMIAAEQDFLEEDSETYLDLYGD
jgi:hypothetical protein